MSNLNKLDFAALDISGKNYSKWVLDAEMYLNADSLGDAIKEGNTASEQNKARAMILLRRHFHEGLKYEYLTVKDPLILWQNLKERYDHLTIVILPKARFDWIHLRLQDFKSVSEYNSVMFRITSQLTLCGEKVSDAEMLEKTYQTFHGSQLILSQQYRQRGFKKYSELISCLLVAEQNNEILLKNHQSRPTGTDPFPEVNAIRYDNNHKYSGHTGSCSRGRGRGRGNYQGGTCGKFKKSYSHQRDGPYEKNEKGVENLCYRCGATGHWARTCRTPTHLVNLYQQSLTNSKGKNMEANFAAGHENIEKNYADGNNNANFAVEHENIETNYADGDNNLPLISGEFLDLDDSYIIPIELQVQQFVFNMKYIK